MKNQVNISLTELPPRVEKLIENDIQMVFGGCYGKNVVCYDDKSCCSQLKCVTNSGNLGGTDWENIPTCQ